MAHMVKEELESLHAEYFETGNLDVPLKALLEYCDPTIDDPWSCGAKIESNDVIYYSENLKDFARPTEDYSKTETYEYNVGRIAYFFEHGFNETEFDNEPITIDIGLSGYTPPWLIVDGNHRIAAAKIRGDKTIRASITGDLEKALRVLVYGEYIDDF